MRKVCVVVPNRASYARVKTVLQAIDQRKDLELQLVLESSTLLERYGPLLDIVKADGFHIAATVPMVIEGSTPVTMAKSAGLGLLELPNIFSMLKPDVVLVVADRFETLPTTIAAAYMNLPVAHLLGGEVTGSIDESIRHAVTKMAHIHFTATQKSAERIVRMGEDPQRVHWVGCPSIDLISKLDMKLTEEDVKQLRSVGVGADVELDPFLIILQHPVTTEYFEAKRQINETLRAVAMLDRPTFMFWPNVDAGSEETAEGIRIFRERYAPKNVRFIKNLPPELFAKLMWSCACMVGNSSAAIREGSFLGTPAVNVGTRQAGRERGSNVLDVGYDAEEIVKAAEKQIIHGRYLSEKIYGGGNAGEKVAEILAEVNLDGVVQKRITY